MLAVTCVILAALSVAAVTFAIKSADHAEDAHKSAAAAHKFAVEAVKHAQEAETRSGINRAINCRQVHDMHTFARAYGFRPSPEPLCKDYDFVSYKPKWMK